MTIKCLAACLLSALSISVNADVTVIPVNGVDDLIAKLGAYNGKGLNYELRLAPGDYLLPDTAMVTLTGDYAQGKSTMFVDKIRLVGGGDGPESVRLIGAGNLRVVHGANSAWIENLTITNGNATVKLADAGNSNRGGGVTGSCILTNCIIAGCKAAIGGAAFSASVSVRGCKVLNNSATSVAGGVHTSCAYDTDFIGNSSAGNGGAAALSTLYRCNIISNTAAGSGGGAYDTHLYSCTNVSWNVATKGNGGGFACQEGRDIKVLDCVFYANKCSHPSAIAYGGGVFGSISVSNCIIRGNYAHKAGGNAPYGGGVAKATIYDSVVSDNYADYGGGASHVIAYGTRFNCNRSSQNDGNNANRSHLHGCEVVGSDLSFGSASCTVFTDIGSEIVLDNPHVNITFRSNYVYTRYPNCTNCLFVGCTAKDAMFFGYGTATMKSHLVNCTVVANTSNYMFTYFKTEGQPLLVENCLFYGNSYQDILCHPNETIPVAIKFSNCVYARSNIDATTLKTSYSSDGTIYQLGGDLPADPKFMGEKDEAHPYSLKRTSPLRGIGAYAQWMAAATDVRGEGFPRADGASVDIGCYQCWLPVIGMKVSIR
ncbi:MAG: hypothetical protein IJ268_13005 [Proteobacteria bacterium]|nr:hypothetical protein [Pseudomonadota bacterium]